MKDIDKGGEGASLVRNFNGMICEHSMEFLFASLFDHFPFLAFK